MPYTIFVETNTGISLIVTADHPFLLADGRLQRADRLTPQDMLMDEKLNPLSIKQLGFGTYAGPIWNIATSTVGPGEPKWGHLINTGGVISGDFYAQLFLVEQALISAPLIGSSEYKEKYNLESLTNISGKASSGAELFRFSPAKKFVPPPGAVNFLPEGVYTSKPGMLRPLDDTVPREIAEYLVWNFQRIYDDITYHVEWYDDTVNAYAWREGEIRHVAILGGLIRHRAVKQEGLGLVIAHEIGHHYGGPPQYPDSPWASCEGQADYWGARVAMRLVWWGPEALRQIQAGAEQLRDLFVNGLMPVPIEAVGATELVGVQQTDDVLAAYSSVGNPSVANVQPMTMMAGCSHPPGECRYQTYLAALTLDDKPACAG